MNDMNAGKFNDKAKEAPKGSDHIDPVALQKGGAKGPMAEFVAVMTAAEKVIGNFAEDFEAARKAPTPEHLQSMLAANENATKDVTKFIDQRTKQQEEHKMFC